MPTPCERAGTFYPPEVIKALEGYEFDGLGNGPTTYRAEDHQCFKEVYVVQGKDAPANPFDLLEVVGHRLQGIGHLRSGHLRRRARPGYRRRLLIPRRWSPFRDRRCLVRPPFSVMGEGGRQADEGEATRYRACGFP